jgi:uncharacterized SAM-binding protein YcdF (DUF218 family)
MFFEISKVVGFFAAPSNTLLVCLLVGLVLSRTVWRRSGFGLMVVAGIGLAVAGWTPLGQALILPLEDRFPVYVEGGKPVDGIIILGGSLDTLVGPARGRPAVNEAAERLIEGVALARTWPMARVVFSGGEGRLVFEGQSEAAAARQVFGDLGLDMGRVTFEDRSRNTRENAVFSASLVRPRAGEHWLLVTSAFHMPRAIGCFRAVGFDVVAYPVDHRTRGAADYARGFDTVGEGLRRTDIAMREWVGLLVYRLSGYTSGLFPGP